jgi:glutamate synthase domain-containing protein 1
MLEAMTGRGPDSAGFAIYGDQVPDGSTKLTLRHHDLAYDWDALAHRAQAQLAVPVEFVRNHHAAVFKIAADAQTSSAYFSIHAPEVVLLSAGQSIEILKAVGLPAEISSDFNLTSMKGSHIIGHTRMATESAVTLEGSHPFSTGQDLCLVHNGSFSNHNRLRTELAYHGYHMKTENDTEVAAGYLTWRMDQGDTLDESLQHALKDLDGFYTLAIGTHDGFAVIRDPIACKPAVLAETDD